MFILHQLYLPQQINYIVSLKYVYDQGIYNIVYSYRLKNTLYVSMHNRWEQNFGKRKSEFFSLSAIIYAGI